MLKEQHGWNEESIVGRENQRGWPGPGDQGSLVNGKDFGVCDGKILEGFE